MENINSAVEAICQSAELLRQRPGQPGARIDLENAVEAAKKALQELRMLYDRTGEIEHLNLTIAASNKVLAVIPTDHPFRIIILGKLSELLGRRFELHIEKNPAENMEDIDRAIEYGELARATTPNANRYVMLYYLGKNLNVRFSQTAKLEDLKLAVQVTKEALSALPDDRHQHAVPCLMGLANSLARLADVTHSLDSLDSAIKAAEAAVEMTPPGHQQRSIGVETLTRLLATRFENTAAAADLDRAIDLLNGLVLEPPNRGVSRVVLMGYLGNVLHQRFERQGAMEDLNDGIKWTKLALEEAQHRDEGHGWLLSNLANRFAKRFERTAKMEDLDLAIRYGQEALEMDPRNHQRTRWLGNLGAFYGLRYEEEHRMEDLNRAIDLIEEAIKFAGANNPDLGAQTNSLANLLRNRFDQHNAISDLDDAEKILQGAIRATPLEHPDQGILQYSLGKTLYRRYKSTQVEEDLERSIAAYKAGWACKNAPTTTRIDLATKAATLVTLRSDWDEAVRLLEDAVLLLPTLGPRYLQNTDKQHMIRRFAGLAAAAAAAALQAGKEASYALQLLELGRSVISGLLLDLRTDISLLKQRHPDLAGEFTRLRESLESGGDIANPAPQSGERESSSSWEAKAQSRRRADSEFQAVMAKIRAQPGFRDFLLPPAADKLMKAADPDPIVVINVSNFRCDAFLVERQRIRAIALPDLTQEDVLVKTQELGTDHDYLASVLEWLWDVLVHPVLKALSFDQCPASDDSWPHLWWIPVGPLSYLPLHAAGYHDGRSGETALDRVMSSYHSSIKSLIAGRQYALQQSRGHNPANALLVSMEQTPSQSKLPFALREVAMLEELCPALHLTPIKPPRFRSDVLEYLRTCKIFHFAGHGLSNPSEPSRSCLLLKDWEKSPLTVGDLQDQRLQQNAPYLAYLSACSTGANDELALVDEAVHLINACQLAGFRHVVGTLWVVSDKYCVNVASRLYQTIRDEGMTDAAVYRGLHWALRALRDGQIDGEDAGRSAVDHQGGALVADDGGGRIKQDEIHGGTADGHTATEDLAELRGAKLAGMERHNLHWVPYIHFGV